VTRRSPWPWLVLVVWCAWLQAVLGRAAAEPGLGGWVPDLGLVLLLALEPRLSLRDAVLAALVVGCTRLAFTADAPTAVAAGLFAAVALSRALRRFVEVDGVVVRPLLAGVAALLGGGLAAAAHLARSEAALGLDTLPLAGRPVLRAAAATALAALFLAPLLRRLPGLSPFAARRKAFAA
jgi:hypothetical protein